MLHNIINLQFLENPIWFGIVIVESTLILMYVLKKKRIKDLYSNKNDLKAKLKDESINMNNVVDSINKSRNLYKILSSNCHPDRFIEPDKKEIAEELFQVISRDKRNFDKLNQHKTIAIEKLGVKIKGDNRVDG